VPKTDPFTSSLRMDLKEKGLTFAEAADEIHKSFSQFRREVRGNTKLGIMPVDTVAVLAQKGIISEFTVQVYWQQVRNQLRFKREKPRYINRSHMKIIT
jgi:hypothetical protein